MSTRPAIQETQTDILVIGGGTGGPMAAIKAKEANKSLKVMLLEKANVKRSGAVSMGMDGLNNAVVPGYATPEQYVKEITVANDGIVHQPAVMAYAQNSYSMIRYLDGWGSSSRRTAAVNTICARCITLAPMYCRCRRGITSRRSCTGSCGGCR